jgi:disulfide oxidoreductase YuzD
VQVDYHDADSALAVSEFADVRKDADLRQLPYPLVLLNGQMVANGSCDPYQIMFLVDNDRREKGLPSRY